MVIESSKQFRIVLEYAEANSYYKTCLKSNICIMIQIILTRKKPRMKSILSEYYTLKKFLRISYTDAFKLMKHLYKGGEVLITPHIDDDIGENSMIALKWRLTNSFEVHVKEINGLGAKFSPIHFTLVTQSIAYFKVYKSNICWND